MSILGMKDYGFLLCPFHLAMKAIVVYLITLVYSLIINSGSVIAATKHKDGSANTASAESIVIEDSLVIRNNAFNGASGRLSVNQASGNSNRQLNLTAIAFNAGEHKAAATVSARQGSVFVEESAALKESERFVLRIDDRAFSKMTGMVGVNQVGGSHNQQMNSSAIAVATLGKAIASHELESVVVSDPNAINHSSPENSNSIIENDATAFKHSSGMFQLNQVLGRNNRSANKMSMRIELKP